jgi:hypothetical protein
MPSLEILKKYASKTSVPEVGRIPYQRRGYKGCLQPPGEFHMGAYSWDFELFDNGLQKLPSKSLLLCHNSVPAVES